MRATWTETISPTGKVTTNPITPELPPQMKTKRFLGVVMILQGEEPTRRYWWAAVRGLLVQIICEQEGPKLVWEMLIELGTFGHETEIKVKADTEAKVRRLAIKKLRSLQLGLSKLTL